MLCERSGVDRIGVDGHFPGPFEFYSRDHFARTQCTPIWISNAPSPNWKARSSSCASSPANDPTMEIDGDVSRLQTRAEQLVRDTYARLTPWQKVQVARHPNRPHFSDYVAALFDEFTPLAGDRLYGEDQAVIAGLGRFRGRAVAVVGPGKGQRHQIARQAQFRHGDAGRLSQGAAPVRHGGPLRTAGDLARAIRPAPIPAWRRKSAASRKPSRVRRRPGSNCACPSSPRSSATACRAAPSRSRRPTASICWSMRSIR